MLLLQGERKSGPPSAAVRAAIEGIDDLARLEDLAVRSVCAGSWEELLPPQTQRRRNGRRISNG
jgi:hypothetical protein